MRFLLLLICLGFSGIFYMFFSFSQKESVYLESLSGNLMFEMLFFIVLGGVLFLYFWKTKKVLYDERETVSYVNWESIKKGTTIFFKKYLYYIGVVLFYASVYLMFQSLDTTKFPYFILFLNVLIFGLFFLTKKFFILQDLLKINAIASSFIYMLFYIYALFFGKDFLLAVDFLNSILIIGIFWLLLWFENPWNRKKVSDPTLVTYFSFYMLIFGVFYSSYILGSTFLAFSIVPFLLGWILFYIPDRVPFLLNSKNNIRYTSLVFLYISSLFSMVYTLNYGANIFIILSLIAGVIFHYKVHFLYQNYISFFVGFCNFFFLFSYAFFEIFYHGGKKDILLLINFFSLSFAFILYTYFCKSKYQHDTHFIHVFWYIVNIFWVVMFFVFSEFDIFNVWFVFLLESMLIFLSYYKLNSL